MYVCMCRDVLQSLSHAHVPVKAEKGKHLQLPSVDHHDNRIVSHKYVYTYIHIHVHTQVYPCMYAYPTTSLHACTY